MKKTILSLALASAMALGTGAAAAETRVTYKSAKSTSSYYQMAVQIAEAMKAGSDGDNIGFWDGFRPQRRQAWKQGQEVPTPVEPFEGPQAVREDSVWNKYKAPRPMVGEVARQLQTIHSLEFTPPVQAAAFRDWGDDPYGGGWNSWNIGVKSEKVKVDITQPIESCPLYICGEAYSDAQGWVEGALQTADIVLGRLGIESLDSTEEAREVASSTV